MNKLLTFTLFLWNGTPCASVTYIFGQDINYPPYAYQNPETGELEGFGKDIAVGITELYNDINIEVVQVNWDDCWDGNTASIGKGLKKGTYDACMTYTHTQGVRNEYMEFSGGILDGESKPAGLIVKLNEDGQPEVVDGMDNLSRKIVVDVKGWAPTADTIKYVENKCTDEPYSDNLDIIPNSDGANNPSEALRMVIDKEVDAMYVYADQAYYYKKQCEDDPNQDWSCETWTKFGVDFAYAQTGQYGYIRNGTTLAMAKLGSGVADAINPYLWKFMETKQYYNICVKHELEASCIPNSYFPKSEDKKDKPYYKDTNEHGSRCSEGYCSCAEEAPKKKSKKKSKKERNKKGREKTSRDKKRRKNRKKNRKKKPSKAIKTPSLRKTI